MQAAQMPFAAETRLVGIPGHHVLVIGCNYAADLDALMSRMTIVRIARVWFHKEQLHGTIGRKQINVVRDMQRHWCSPAVTARIQ